MNQVRVGLQTVHVLSFAIIVWARRVADGGFMLLTVTAVESQITYLL